MPQGVTAEITDGVVRVKGGKGEMAVPLLPYCSVAVSADDARHHIAVTIDSTARQARSNWGTMAALINNAVLGVHSGFVKKLQLEGIGYRASLEGKNLLLALGFSHPMRYACREGISFAVDKNIITISGINKELVGKAAAEIRMMKKPEPYQGKGIRYVGEVVRRKAGKKAAAVAEAKV